MAAEIDTHEQTSQSGNVALPLGEPSEHAGFSPLDFSSYVIEDTKTQEELKASIETTVSSAGSMQTPPPTSTSASRRKAQQAQVARLVKDSASKGVRRLSLPAATEPDQQSPNHVLAQESPSHFPNLQFSPDGFTFPMSGPATAPVYPQHKLFWDSEQSGSGMNIEMSMNDTFTAFDIGTSRNLDPFVSDNEQGNMLPFTTSPAFDPVESSAGISRSGHGPALNQMNVSSSTAVVTQGSSGIKHRGTLVNPSLLFSSPSRATEAKDIPNLTNGASDDVLQPYAQQIRDAQIEKDLKSRKQKRKRPPEYGDSPAVKAAIEALREDNTDSTKSSPVVADSFFGALPIGGSQPGQDFPLRKRLTPDNHYHRRDSQSSLHRRKSDKVAAKRPAVTLKIDASGRAATQMSVVKEGCGNKMDIDGESDSSDSNSSLSDGRMVISRQQSFSRPRSRQRQGRKDRFTDDPYSHSQKSSYASTFVSVNSGNVVPRLRRTHVSKQPDYAHAQIQASQSSLRNDDNVSDADTEPDSEEDTGDAQSELRKVVRERALKNTKIRASWSAPKRNLTEIGEPIFSQDPVPNPYYSTRGMTSGHGHQDPHSNISPTTITDPDLTTPSSARESNISNESTRCVCNTADGNGQLMIQWYRFPSSSKEFPY